MRHQPGQSRPKTCSPPLLGRGVELFRTCFRFCRVTGEIARTKRLITELGSTRILGFRNLVRKSSTPLHFPTLERHIVTKCHASTPFAFPNSLHISQVTLKMGTMPARDNPSPIQEGLMSIERLLRGCQKRKAPDLSAGQGLGRRRFSLLPLFHARLPPYRSSRLQLGRRFLPLCCRIPPRVLA